MRQTSGTLCYDYDGISNYYYSDQLKQNLANANALKSLGRKLILPTTPLKRGKLHTLQPASLPISIQLRTQKTMQLILAHSRHWLLNKAYQFASVHMPPKTPKVFEMMAGTSLKIPNKHLVLEHALFAVAKNFEKLSNITSNTKHVHMRRKQTLTKLYQQHLKGLYKQHAWDIKKEKGLNKHCHEQKQLKQTLDWRFKHQNDVLKTNQKLNISTNPLNLNISSKSIILMHKTCHKPYVSFCNVTRIPCLMVYKNTNHLLHPMKLFGPKCYFNDHPKQKVMRFALAYLGTKTYDNATKRLIGPRLATMHVEKSINRQSRKKQGHYYDFQFLNQLKKNTQLKFGFVSPLSKLSVTLNKQKAKDPMFMLSTSTPFYLANQQKQSSIKQQHRTLVDPENAVFKTRDVPQRYHPDHSVDISQAEQKAINTVDPRFATLGRFNRPLKLGLFAFIAGKFPMGVEQGYSLGKGKTKGQAHRKANRKPYKTAINANVNCTLQKLTPLSYSLHHKDALKVGLTRLNTALRFELTLNLKQTDTPARLRSTLSVRL